MAEASSQRLASPRVAEIRYPLGKAVTHGGIGAGRAGICHWMVGEWSLCGIPWERLYDWMRGDGLIPCDRCARRRITLEGRVDD